MAEYGYKEHPPHEKQERVTKGGDMFKYILTGVLAVGVLAVGVRVATQALFTDTQSVGANTFTTGTVDLVTSPATALVTFSGMAPGDKVVAPIEVSNSGTLEFRYAVKSTTTEDVLAPQLDMTVRGPAAASTGCDAAGFGTFGTGVLYATGDLGSTAGSNLIGDPAQGFQTNDRTLAAAASEFMCFQVELPLATGNSFQGLTSTATVDFVSEQTANN